MSHTLELDSQFTTTLEKLWSALTRSDKLAKWTMNNSFEPVVGRAFEFRTEPSGGWDGLITGEVLAVEAPNRLSYTWESGSEKGVVHWTLQDLGNGKVNLHLEHSGISSMQALNGAKYGWQGWFGELEKVLAE